MSPVSVLNPLASSFHPRFDEPLDFGTIYTNGVPSASFFGAHPEHTTLHNIDDDALDEAFPPSADEAAELDAVMDFVLTMSYLNVVEEQEERARSDFSHVAGTRWEARRARGMVGRPHPAKSPKATDSSFVMAKNHQLFSQETDIVPFEHGGSKKVHMPHHDQECMHSRNAGVGHHGKTRGRFAKGRSYAMPIQQPRKQHR